MFTAATVRILGTIYHFRFRFLFKDCFASFCFAFACRIHFVPEPGQYSELNPDSESDTSHFGANVVVDTTSLDSTSSQIRFEKGLDFGTGRECGRSKRKRKRKRNWKTRRTRTMRRSSKGTRTRVWERKRKRKSEKERKRKGRVKDTGRRRGKGRGKRRGKGRGRERGRFEFHRHRTPASAGSPVPEASARRRAGHGAPAYKQGCPPINLVSSFVHLRSPTLDEGG